MIQNPNQLGPIISRRSTIDSGSDLPLHFSASPSTNPPRMASRLGLAITTTTPTPGRKQKTDIAWKHCQMIDNDGKTQLMCLHCQKVFKGGGIHRIKEHLAGHKGNGSVCLRVPTEIQTLMRENLQLSAMKSKRKRKPEKKATENTNGDHDYLMENHKSEKFSLPYNEPTEPNSSLFNQQRKEIDSEDYEIETPDMTNLIERNPLLRPTTITSPILRPTTSTPLATQPPMTNQQVNMAIGRFLYDIGAPMGSVNSVHFQPMIDAIASCGFGVVGPSYHDIRGLILKNVLKEVKSNTEKYRVMWEKTGCSILVEQWDDKSGRALLNFLVHCREGTVFLKSVEATEFIHSPDSLVGVIKAVVEEIGEKNILQVITSGDEHFAAARQTLMQKCPNLYWAPCASQCVDLVLKDFSECDWIHSLIVNAQSMTRFIYNNPAVLNLVRRFTFGNDIVEPGGSRYATNFVTLRQFAAYKVQLQSMVTSQEWMGSPYSKRPEALEMLDLLTSEQFWSSCNLAIQLTNPLLRLLRIVSEKNGSMGYVYAGMYRVKEAIKKELVKKEEYMWFWNRIDYRWGQYQHLPLHAAGFYLNPKFFYSVQGDVPNKIASAVLDCVERLVPEETVQDKIMKEMNSYKVAEGDFGRNMAIRGRDTLSPVEWWSTYGGACPNLTRLAIRILGQTCSARFGKVIAFDQMLDASNCLERQRLSDRVFVQYNLQLRVNKNIEHDLLDPIASEAGPLLEDWITGKDIPLDSESQDWMALDPPSNISTLFGPSEFTVESMQLQAGRFDDYEIFNMEEDAVNIALG